ncbi:MAG: lysophospholipid acyltransferase family protein [Gemmatimonadetes bacterium]|nr:lysophospholipid acyltransferase family protein [Gemmatimonadota bacterium]
MRRGLRHWLVGSAGRGVLDAWLATLHFEVRGAENYQCLWDGGRPVIFALWHGRLLPLTYLHRRQGITTLVSRSRDGEYITRIMERWGYAVVRGSSTRGGRGGLRELLRHARAGRTLAFTPDGPRGPRQKVKLGAVVAAQLSGLPLVPMAAGADRAWWVRSWDRFLLPRPFARVCVAYGAPREIPRGADARELRRQARLLEDELNRLLEEVDGRGQRG